MSGVFGLNLVKGGVIFTVLWWAWASRRPRARELVVCAILGSLVALLITRSIAFLLPFRPRPMFDPAIHFRAPPGWEGGGLIDWSAFPSDHAAVFVALAVGVWAVSRAAGLFGLAWTGAVILWPRLYLGIHRPTDLLVGALIGFLSAKAVDAEPIQKRVGVMLDKAGERSPGLLHAVLFLTSFEMAELFDGARRLAVFAVRVLRGH